MNLSISTLAYLFLQLSPFIIISYFSLSSVFNRDIKGIIFLFGIIFNLALFWSISGGFKALLDSFDADIFKIYYKYDCNTFDSKFNTIGGLPVNTSILSFTFWYIMFTLIELDMKEIGVTHGMDPVKARAKWNQNFPTPFINTNWPAITILLVLLVANMAFSNVDIFPEVGCFNTVQHLTALAISGCLGIAWSAMIRSTNTPQLQYFQKYKNNENCKKASTKQFRCKIYKNGQEVGETSGDNIFTVQE